MKLLFERSVKGRGSDILPDVTTGDYKPDKKYLRENNQLAIVPGGHQFFGDQSEGHVRICIATSHEILEEGLRRLKAGVESLMEKR